MLKQRYRLKSTPIQVDETTGYHFKVDGIFIPLQTLRAPKTTDFGSIDGRQLREQGLHRVFELYEGIQVMLQNLVFFDLSAFELQGSKYVHNAAENLLFDAATEDYHLYYLEKI